MKKLLSAYKMILDYIFFICIVYYLFELIGS